MTQYETNIRNLLTLHYISEAQSRLEEITADIAELESFERQTRGDLLYHVREILFSYQVLAAKVVRDQRNFSLSHYHASQSVRVAQATGDIDLIAAGLYIQGSNYLAWGMFGTLQRRVFKIQPDKINKAITNFEQAKKLVENTQKRLHPQLEAQIDGYLSRAYAIRSVERGEEMPAKVITLLNGMEEKIGQEHIKDPYQRVLVTGSRIGFVRENYHNMRAAAFNAAGMTGAALKELRIIEGLQEGTIRKDLTRSQIWLDIVAADTFMRLERFEDATKRAKKALLGCQDINSVTNLTSIVDIHGRLLRSPYQDEPDVEELGNMLTETVIAPN